METRIEKNGGVSELVNQQLCGFIVDGDLYAVPVLAVQEVIRPQKATRVPLSDHSVRGLINLRGQIVTLLSLRRLFGLQDKEGDDHMNVIVRSEGALIAVMVDEICDVIDVNGQSFENTPETISENLKKYISGVHKLEDRLLIVLDLQKVLAAEEEIAA